MAIARTVVATLSIVAIELFISWQFYWVSPMPAFFCFVNVGLIPLLLAAIAYARRWRRLGITIVTLSFAFFVLYEVPKIYELHKIHKEMNEVVATLNQYSKDHGHLPATLEDASFAFKSDITRKAVESYEPDGNQFVVTIHSPDPSTGYVYYSDGRIIHIDD